MKTVEGEESKWPQAAHAVFWAERITIQRATGHSPYFLAHGTEPLLPFDLTEATYLTEPWDGPVSSAELLATRARQLEKREDDLEKARERVFVARKESARQFERAVPRPRCLVTD